MNKAVLKHEDKPKQAYINLKFLYLPERLLRPTQYKHFYLRYNAKIRVRKKVCVLNQTNFV